MAPPGVLTGDPQVPVKGGAPGGPGVLARGELVQQRVGGIHQAGRGVGPDANDGGGGPTWGTHSREGGATVAGGADEDDPLLVDQLVDELDEAAIIGEGGGLAVAQVHEVTAMLSHHAERADQPRQGLHGAQAAVPNLDGDQLHPRGNAVQLRALRVIATQNASHVGAMGAIGGDKGHDITLVINVDGEVEHGVHPKGGELVFLIVVGQEGKR